MKSAVGIYTILAAFDCVPSGERVLDTAKKLAKLIGAKVRLVHANDLGAEVSGTAAECEELFHGHSAHAAATLARKVAELKNEGIEVEAVAIEGIPSDVILKEAKNADLVVMGKHWKHKWRLFSRNTVEAVLEAARCPVVIAGGNPNEDSHRARMGWLEQINRR
jgi:nucleotide-binding universal stress UspA family protein